MKCIFQPQRNRDTEYELIKTALKFHIFLNHRTEETKEVP